MTTIPQKSIYLFQSHSIIGSFHHFLHDLKINDSLFNHPNNLHHFQLPVRLTLTFPRILRVWINLGFKKSVITLSVSISHCLLFCWILLFTQLLNGWVPRVLSKDLASLENYSLFRVSVQNLSERPRLQIMTWYPSPY